MDNNQRNPETDLYSGIGFFLSLDEWGIHDAVQIIEDINPDESTIEGAPNDFRFTHITFHNGDTIPQSDPQSGAPLHWGCNDLECRHCEGQQKRLEEYSFGCRQLLRLLERSYDAVTRASPREWIERALSKNIRPEWLDWAIEKGIYQPGAEEPRDVRVQNQNAAIILMAKPERLDDWFTAIADAVIAFEAEFHRTPRKAELWNRLSNTPPHGYDIETLPDGALLMGQSKLERAAFYKRYDRYFPSPPDGQQRH